MIKQLDLCGLNFIRANIHLAWIWLWVDNVKSSMNPLLAGSRIPNSVLGPRVSFSAAFNITKGITEMVQPVTMRKRDVVVSIPGRVKPNT